MANQQQINVALNFTANTQQAKMQINSLLQGLSQLSSGVNININDTQMRSAAAAAKELQYHLSSAINTNTGKLDLSKLNASIASANSSLSGLMTNLAQGGAQGQRSFIALAQSIAACNAPTFQLNNALATLWTRMKSIVAYQSMTSVYQGVINFFSSAYEYAQDLNESLTNIRIVTNYSTKEMEQFAKSANKAAKALGASTVAMTDASLIYFQQGLGMEEAEKRAEITVKLANVTGESVEKVSDQLTAVWNNFYDGSKSLDYYADVITALGAATASSTDEISEGLNKFAAVAETVGLSYEYATAALATVTATTRQSADVVGTAFKTLFARIQDLELGKTLDDGVTLGKYSQALSTIGVQVLDVNGNMREMDDILNDMGAKWDKLSGAQKTATAQTVAGIRQYTQLIALMDNWDFFAENLQTIADSEGALQKQQDKYAEGWEYARKRVTASLEAIYDKFFDDEGLIKLTNGLADVIEGFDNLIDGVGGFKNIFGIAATFIVSLIANKIQPAITSLVSSFQTFTAAGAAKVAGKQFSETQSVIESQLNTNSYSVLEKAQLESSAQLMRAKQKLFEQTQNLTTAEKLNYEIALSDVEIRADAVTQAARELEILNKKFETIKAINIEEQVATQKRQNNSIHEQRLNDNINTKKQEIVKAESLITKLRSQNESLSRKIASAEITVQHAKEGSAARERAILTIRTAQADIAKNELLIEQKSQITSEQNRASLAAMEANLDRVVKKNSQETEVQAKMVQSLVEAYNKAAQAASQMASQGNYASIESMANGTSSVNLKSITDSFFTNSSSYADLGTGKANSIINAKQELSTYFSMLQNEGVIDTQQLEQVNTILEKQYKNGAALKAEIEQLRNNWEKVGISAKQTGAIIAKNNGGQGIEEANDLILQYKKNLEDLRKKQDELNRATDNYNPQHKFTFGDQISTLTSSIGTLAMSLSAVSSLINILEEGFDPTSLQDWSNALMSASMLIPGVLSATRALSGAVKAANAQATIAYTIQQKENIAKINSIATDAAKRAGITLEALATGALTKEQAAEILVSKQGMAIDKAKLIIDLLTAKTDEERIKIQGKLLTLEGLDSKQKSGLIVKQTLLNLLQQNWLIIIIAIVAILALLISRIEAEATAQEKAAQSVEQYSKALENLTSQASKAAEELENVKNKLQKYKDLQDSFDGLVKGSTEWNEALSKSNEIVSELLKTYPELVNYLNEDGTISEIGYQYLEGTATIEKLEGQLAVSFADIGKKFHEAKVQMYKELNNVEGQQRAFEDNGWGATGVFAEDGKVYWQIPGEKEKVLLGDVQGKTIEEQDKSVREYSNAISSGIIQTSGAYTENWVVTEVLGDQYSELLAIYNEGAKEVVDTFNEETKDWVEYVNTQMKLSASSILTVTKGFSSLTDTQQEAAEHLYTQQLTGAAIQATDVDNIEVLKQLQGFNEEEWTNTGGEINEKLINTTFGNDLVENYLTQYYSDKIKNFDKTLLKTGEKAGELIYEGGEEIGDITLTATEIMVEAFSDAALNMHEASKYITEVSKMTNVQAAAITGNFDLLNESEMASIGTKRQGGGYDLNQDFIQQWAQHNDYNDQLAWNNEARQFTIADGVNETEQLNAALAQANEAYGNLIQNAQDYNFELLEAKRAKMAQEEAKALLIQEAQGLDVKVAALEVYAKENQELYNLSAKAAAQLTVMNAKYSKGVEALSESLEDNKKALQKWRKTGNLTYDSAKALANIITALEDVFGVKVSTSFVDEYYDKIKLLAEGGEQAVKAMEDLELLAAKDYVANLAITEEGKKALDGLLEQFTELEATTAIGKEIELDINNDAALESLNELIRKGVLSTKDIQAAFNAIGWSPDFTLTEVPQKSTSISAITTGSGFNEATGELTGAGNTEYQKVETTTYSEILGFGDAPVKVTRTPRTSASISQGSTKGKDSKSKNKNLSDETERYHKIDKTLSRLNKEYKEISKAKDRAFGKKRLDYLDQEIAKTKELAEATRTKLAEAQKHFAADREAMISKYGMSTDKYGYITNYDEMVAKQVEAYNSDPEGQEDAYKQFKQDLANYEESVKLIEDLKIQLNDYVNEELDKELEKIQYKFELEIELSDMDLKRLEWQIDNLSDAVGNLAAKFDLMGRQMETNVRKANAAKTTIESILGQGGLSLADIEGKSASELSAMLEGKNFTKDQISKLQTQMSNLYEYSDAMEEIMDSVSDNLVASFEDMNKELDKSVDKLDHMNSMIDAYRNIIDLAGADALGISDELLERMGEAQYNIANSNIEIAKVQLAQNKAALESLQERINAAQAADDEKAVEELQEAYDEIYATVQDNELALLEATSSALEARTQLFETEMDNIIKTFEDAMTGAYGTFNAMQEAFDQQKEINDRYIDDYQKIYELSKLNRDLVNSIDDTDSIRAKERLRDLQAEINELQESNTQMTQYEVDELRARYELRLAEIALEEAQNAKSMVRMSRDSEGNWGYVYTADEAAVGDAQQNYEDKLYAYQQMLYKYTDEMQARLVQIPAEYAEAIRAIYEDQTLNDEERRLRIEETAEYYQGMYDHVIQQLGLVNEDAKILYEQDWNAYSEATGYKISKDEEWVDSFEETITSQITGYTTLEDAQWAFKDASDQMLTELENRYVDYREDVKETLDLAIDDIDKFVGDDTTEGSLAYYLKIAEEAAGDAAVKAKDMGEANKTAFETAAKAAADNLTKYSATVTEWNKQTETITTAIGTLIEEYAKLSETLEDVAEDYEEVNTAKANYESSGDEAGDEGNTDTSNTNDGPTLSGRTTDENNPINVSINGETKMFEGETYVPIWTNGNKYWVKMSDLNDSRKQYKVIQGAGGKSYYMNGPISKYSFDTGGYTGTWDASGRLAMLHQKELVLNASDTANFLTAVDILRDITKVIDLQALSQSNALSALSAASVGTSAQVIEQEVTIHAEFPNATERSEIEAAFDTLLNRASQFANRKNK